MTASSPQSPFKTGAPLRKYTDDCKAFLKLGSCARLQLYLVNPQVSSLHIVSASAVTVQGDVVRLNVE